MLMGLTPAAAPAALATGGAISAPTPAGQPDYNAYLAQNPDVDAWARGLDARDLAYIGQQGYNADDLAERGRYHYETHGNATPPPISSSAIAGGSPTGSGAPSAVSAADITSYIQSMPGYQAQMDEGNRNYLARAGAAGALGSGATARALHEIGQNTFNQFRDSEINKLWSLVTGSAMPAANATGNAGQNYVNNVAGANDNATNAALARASGYQAAGDAWSGAAGFAGQQLSSLPWGTWFGGGK